MILYLLYSSILIWVLLAFVTSYGRIRTIKPFGGDEWHFERLSVAGKIWFAPVILIHDSVVFVGRCLDGFSLRIDQVLLTEEYVRNSKNTTGENQ